MFLVSTAKKGSFFCFKIQRNNVFYLSRYSEATLFENKKKFYLKKHPLLLLLCFLLIAELCIPQTSFSFQTKKIKRESCEGCRMEDSVQTVQSLPVAEQIGYSHFSNEDVIESSEYTQVESPAVVQMPSPTPLPIIWSSVHSGDGLNADLLFSLVNNYRMQNGLSSFQKRDDVCSVASERAPEVYSEVYLTHSMHAGMTRRGLWGNFQENIISYKSEQGALQWWINSPVHRSTILGNYTYSCIACSGNSCSEIFAK